MPFISFLPNTGVSFTMNAGRLKTTHFFRKLKLSAEEGIGYNENGK
jgi:hypothetical protein